MLILESCLFLATPKTGSKWCHEALKACVASSVEERNGSAKEYHTTLEMIEQQGNPGFVRERCIAFVRHPLAWYRSYWNHRMRQGWNPVSSLDDACQSDTYEVFVQKVLKHRPGWLSNHILGWVGSEEYPAGFIGRHEHLKDDLAWAMKHFRVEFDEQVLRETPRTNIGDYIKHPTPCSKELEDHIMLAESKMLDRFYE